MSPLCSIQTECGLRITLQCVCWPKCTFCCCAWNKALQVNCNGHLFLIGNEQADEFVANAISHINTISNQVNKQEHRGATIVSKFTSSHGTTWLPMPNELSQSEPAIGKSCIWSACYMLIHDIYVYVITPSGGIINRNIPTGRCYSWFIPALLGGSVPPYIISIVLHNRSALV